MTRASLPSGIELEYDAFKRANDPAMLLVNGSTARPVARYDELCRPIVDADIGRQHAAAAIAPQEAMA